MPGKGSKRATRPSLSGCARWAGYSTSTAWCGSPSSRSRARPRPSPGCAPPARSVVFSPTTRADRWPRRGEAGPPRHPGRRATCSPRRWPRPRWSSPASACCVCAGPGVVEALEARGARCRCATATPTPWWSGFHRDFDYERLRERPPRRAPRRPAHRHQRRRRPTRRPTGRSRAAGAILAAVADGQRASSRWSPASRYAPMADLVRARLGDDGIVVGRPPDTDGAPRPPARLPVRPRAHRASTARPTGRRPGAGRRSPGPGRPSVAAELAVRLAVVGRTSRSRRRRCGSHGSSRCVARPGRALGRRRCRGRAARRARRRRSRRRGRPRPPRCSGAVKNWSTNQNAEQPLGPDAHDEDEEEDEQRAHGRVGEPHEVRAHHRGDRARRRRPSATVLSTSRSDVRGRGHDPADEVEERGTGPCPSRSSMLLPKIQRNSMLPPRWSSSRAGTSTRAPTSQTRLSGNAGRAVAATRPRRRRRAPPA